MAIKKAVREEKTISNDVAATFCSLAEKLLTYQECDIKRVIAFMRSVIDLADLCDYMEYTGSSKGIPLESNEEYHRKVMSGEIQAEQQWWVKVYRPLSIRDLDGIIELQNYGRFLLDRCMKEAAADTPEARKQHFEAVMQKIHGKSGRLLIKQAALTGSAGPGGGG
jgi:hypothetical protein